MSKGQGLAEYALVAALIGIIAIVVVILLSGDNFQEWAVWCGEQGGRVADQHATGLGSAGSGGVVVTSSTTYFCLSPDGGILDIR